MLVHGGVRIVKDYVQRKASINKQKLEKRLALF